MVRLARADAPRLDAIPAFRFLDAFRVAFRAPDHFVEGASRFALEYLRDGLRDGTVATPADPEERDLAREYVGFVLMRSREQNGGA